MTADQSPDLVTALRELVEAGEVRWKNRVSDLSEHRAFVDDLRAILDAYPTPAQSSEQEVVALREEVADLTADRDAWKWRALQAEPDRDDALARLAALILE